MKFPRRQFLHLAVGAAALPALSRIAWPVAARAQQTAMPVIGFLSSRSADSDEAMLAALRRGLGEGGYVEGRSVTIEYRFADGRYDRMPELMTELSRRNVTVLVIGGITAGDIFIRQMRASSIPVVFNTRDDPVRYGLVASLIRPGGNVTGVSSLLGELVGKEFGLLLELVTSAKTIAMVFNPDNSGDAVDNAREAAAERGLRLNVLNASTDSELEAVFATLNRVRVDAVFVATSPFYLTRAKQIAALAAQYRVPAMYARREYVDAGGLISYGYDIPDGYRQMGIYTSRILKGGKPADLPVVQPTKFELVINRKAATELGLEIPAKLLAISDEVIE